MKKISIMILLLVAVLASCKKTPEVNLKYVDVERDLITVGTTTATIQCDYEYIATLKKAFLNYCEGTDTINMSIAEMSVVQKTLYVELSGLKENTTYSYYYEFANGFNSMRSAAKTFKTEASPVTPPEITLPTVVTAEVTEISSNSAQCGGEVTNDGGAEVTERGICWSTNVDPTLNDSYITSGTGTGAFIAMMDSLEANTTYHVRAYASNEKGTAYGLDREFTTLSSGGGSGDNDYVDLGLPSGTLWATCNVGANAPEEYGDYFAWAEIETKTYYFWEGYRYGHTQGSGHTFVLRFTKYCNNTIYGYIGFTDTLTVLQSMDDAAIANWGSDWRMPTWEEMEELVENTTHAWTTQNGVFGSLFTATNGNSLFLPAAGRYIRSDLRDAGVSCCYHSSSLWDEPYSAKGLWLNYNTDDYHSNDRTYGCQVRAVRSTK